MKDLLPIGSVVLLKEANKRIMVTGYYPSIINNKSEVEITYDYCGCIFPEGIMDSEKNILFNHEQIDSIFYYGLIDEEQKFFMEQLKQAVEEDINVDTDIELPNLNNEPENNSDIETL